MPDNKILSSARSRLGECRYKRDQIHNGHGTGWRYPSNPASLITSPLCSCVPREHVNIREPLAQEGRLHILLHVSPAPIYLTTTTRQLFEQSHGHSSSTAKMGVSLSTARYLAPLSFAYDFALQQYGLNSKPNMLDIHERNISFWSPNPYFIGAFFFPQQL